MTKKSCEKYRRSLDQSLHPSIPPSLPPAGCFLVRASFRLSGVTNGIAQSRGLLQIATEAVSILVLLLRDALV